MALQLLPITYCYCTAGKATNKNNGKLAQAGIPIFDQIWWLVYTLVKIVHIAGLLT